MSKRPNDTGKRELTPAEKKQRALGQWYSGPWLARRLWCWAPINAQGYGVMMHRGQVVRVARPISVIEPTVGLGALLVPPLEMALDLERVCAVDIDPKNTKVVHHRFAKHLPRLTVHTGDFLKMTPSQLGKGFDFAPVNFPFENNAHIDCTEHAFSFTRVVTGIYPADVSYSEKRGSFWDWHDIVREARLVKRPKFGGRFTPMTNFVVLDLRRRQHRRKDGEATPAMIEWWG
jgi:hypothetical protein